MKFKQASSSPEERKLPLLAPGVAVRATMEIGMKAKLSARMADWSFQDKVITEVVAAIAKKGRVMLRAPTAAGKTTMARKVVEALLRPGRVVWFLVNRDHLVRQAVEELKRIDPDVEIGVIQSGQPETPDAPIQVCSVQSLPTRIARFRAPAVLVWDEAHHVMAKSWRKIVDAFPKAKHLGLSATPERADGNPLGDVFHHLVLAPAEAELEVLGVLARCRYFAPEGVRLGDIRRKGGEFETKSAEAALSAPQIVGCAVAHYLSHANGRATILFAASIKASQEMAEKFRDAGVPAEHLDGETPNDKRQAALERLRTGKTKVICNVDVFVEGLNVPAIGCVIIMRPTLSLARFLQMVGRGRRVTADYPDLIVLDHAGNVALHGLPNDERSWSLTEARPKVERATAERHRHCPVCECAHEFATKCPECGHVYTAADRTPAQVFGWLREISPPEGCETQAAFARRHGISPAYFSFWRRKQIPMDGIFVRIIEADAWLAQRPVRASTPDGCETRSAFAKRYGVPYKTAQSWVKAGLPLRGNFVESDRADVWVAGHSRIALRDGYETQRAFARRHCVAKSTVATWVRAGLPMKGNFVESEKADLWVQNNRPRPLESCETQASFAKRHGVSDTCVSRWGAKAGMPMDGIFVRSNEADAWLAERNRRKTVPRTPHHLTEASLRTVNADRSPTASW